MEFKYDVVALGELLIDFAPSGTGADGYPILASHPGGAPANFLAALSAYGGDGAMIAKVGDDSFGNLLIDTLRERGIDTSGIIKDRESFTTLAFVTLDSTGDRSFSFARKPGADTQLRKEEIDYSLFDSARVFHFGTLSLTDEPARSATLEAIAYAKSKDLLISFDPNLRKPLWKNLDSAKEMMLLGLKMADIVKISDEEIEFLFGEISNEDAAKILHEEYGVKLLYITMGKRGAYYSTGKISGYKASYDKGVSVDTTGAGDIFGGSAMFAFLRLFKGIEELDESDMDLIVSFASIAAGLSTTRSGGISSIPTYDEVLEALSKLNE